MNGRIIQALVVGLCLTSLAAGCSINSPANDSQSQSGRTSAPIPNLSPSSSATPATSTITAAGSSPTSVGSATPSGWSTYSDPNGLYSIQYPNTLGNLNVPATKSGDLKASQEVELNWNLTDFYVYIGINAGLELQRELIEWHLIPQQTITVHGLTGTLYTVPGWQGVDERAFLNGFINGTSTIYEIDLNGGLPGDEPLPSFWKEILNSFQVPAI
jgi:hypothetical protein